MESVCELTLDNRLRLCSAVFDALMPEVDSKGDIAQLNYVEERRCLTENMLPEITLSPIRVLKCTLAEAASSPKFYVLVDSRERGAAFVFIKNGSNQLEPRVRLTEVGALLNPIRTKTGARIAKDRQMDSEYDRRRLTSENKRKNAEPVFHEKVSNVEKEEEQEITKEETESKLKSNKKPRVRNSFEESSESANVSRRKIKLLIDLKEQPTKEVLLKSEGTERRKIIDRPSTKNLGKMSTTELEARLREIWRSYNPKCRRDVSRKKMPKKPKPLPSRRKTV